MNYKINLPRIVHIGAGACSKISQVLQELNCKKPFLVTDTMMVQLGYCKNVTSQLLENNIETVVFADTVPEPTVSSVEAGLRAIQQEQYDCIIALGGGSPIDSAKAISILQCYGGAMSDYKVPVQIENQGLPVIAIPTTAGTGSEATSVMVITDELSGEKMLCMGSGLTPAAALVDYELTLSVPPRTTADTGIDSLTHAIESYVSRKANPFTDSVALTAMQTIFANIRTACAEPDNREARAAMMLAATQGGIAFANASVTLIHGMSRPIGALFHVPHGLSNAMLLPEVTAWSVDHAEGRYAQCARYMGIAQEGDSDSTATSKLVEGLRQLNRDLSVPTPRAYGISESSWFDSLEMMAQQALDSGSPANNPRVPESADIVALYHQVWSAE